MKVIFKKVILALIQALIIKELLGALGIDVEALLADLMGGATEPDDNGSGSGTDAEVIA